MIIFKIKVKKFEIINKNALCAIAYCSNSYNKYWIKSNFILYNLFDFGFFIWINKDILLKIKYRKFGFKLKDFLYHNNVIHNNTEGYVKIK